MLVDIGGFAFSVNFRLFWNKIPFFLQNNKIYPPAAAHATVFIENNIIGHDIE